MAKMVPIEARQSMLDEPSRGSKQTTYFPLNTCKKLWLDTYYWSSGASWLTLQPFNDV